MNRIQLARLACVLTAAFALSACSKTSSTDIVTTPSSSMAASGPASAASQ